MIIVSHRGAYSFVHEADGTWTTRRGAGGIAGALEPLLRTRDDTSWIAAAMTPDDREAAAAGVVATVRGLQLLELPTELHRLHYDVVSNGVLWFLHHGLFGLGRDPVFDDETHEAIEAYRAVNARFAIAVCERAAPGEAVLVQDYHLALVPELVRAQRPDLGVVHFTHTPFAGPETMRVLPDALAQGLLRSLSCSVAGFHTPRWGRAYAAAAAAVGIADVRWFSAPLGPDVEAIERDAHEHAVEWELARIDEQLGERLLIVRADRTEPSKNIIRGFQAFDHLLTTHPHWRERVVFLACLNPSRETLPLYREYARDVRAMVDAVNERWSTDDWLPIVLDERDDYHRTLAAYRRADIVFVNPVRDGLNLVAKEAPVVNERDAVLCLSREAGAFAELSGVCEPLHPFDIRQQADALARALERRGEATAFAALRAAATETSPRTWLDAQLRHLEP